MRVAARLSGVARAVILGTTIVFTALVLVVNRTNEVEPIALSQGQPAPQTFVATDRVSVVDQQATEAARAAERLGVDEVYTEDAQTTEAVLESIQDFFANAEAAAEPLEVPDDDVVVPTTTTTSTTTTTTLPEETSTTEPSSDTSTTEATTTSEETTTSSTTTSTTTTTTIAPPPPALKTSSFSTVRRYSSARSVSL